MTTKVTDIQARIGASVGGFEAGMKSAAASASIFEKELAKVEAAQRSMAQYEAAAYAEQKRLDEARIASQEKVGKAFLATGAVIALGIGMAVKSAVDYQAAFANLEKVLPSNTPSAVFGALNTQLLELSKTIPASADQLAILASRAAQLGVPVKDLANFTRAAVALGQVTQLSAEDATVGLAKLGNVMEPGKFADNIQRAGSALLALGNVGASVESEVLDMAQRIAGAGVTIGLTEPQVLAFANALTSVGLDAEAGGTAISRVMMDMDVAVSSGGKNLDKFAQVSGMSADKFATSFKSNAAGTVASFIEGLHRIQTSGGNVVTTLDGMGLGAIRVRDTLLRASSASDLLTQSLRVGDKAWADGTELQDAAAKRYDTVAAKLSIAKNNLQDTAITMGSYFLPALAAGADKVTALIQVFNDLPAPAKDAIMVLGTLGASALTIGGAMLTVVPKIKEFMVTLESAGPIGARAATAIRSMGSAVAGPLGIALALGTVALGAWMNKQAEAKQRVMELTEAIQEDGGAIGDNTRQQAASMLVQDGVISAAREMGIAQQTMLDAALGNADAQAQVTAALQKQGDVISSGVARQHQLQNINTVRDAIEGQSGALKDAITNAHDMAETLGKTASTAPGAATALSGVAASMQTVGDNTRIAASAITDFENALKGLYDMELGGEAAADDITKAIQEVEKAAEGKKTKGGKVTSEERAAATEAGKEARLKAIARGDTKAQANLIGQQAKDRALAADRASAGGGSTYVDPLAVREAMRALVDKELAAIDWDAKQGDSTNDLIAKSKAAAAQVEHVAKSIGMTDTQAKHYAQTLLDIPTVVNTAVNTPGLTEASARIEALQQKLAVLNGALAINPSAGTLGQGLGVYKSPGDMPAVAAGSGLNLPAKHFAVGGIEDHSAQIGEGGRYWAEPETGGEAYIPLGASKRAGSVALLSEVAARFGLTVARGGAAPVQVVHVPTQQTHTETHPVNLNGPITVMAPDPSTFTDWSRTQGSFGAGGVS